MANRFTFPRETALDANGNPLAGAKLYFYEAGTTNPADTFADEALTIANANPVVADSAGRFGDIFLQAADYKVILNDAADVTIWTADPVSGTVIASGDKFIPSQQNPADMTVLVGPGTIWDAVAKTRLVLAAQTTALMVAPASFPRNDIVYIGRVTGVVGVQTGAEAVTPVDPTIPDGKLPVARVRLATTTIAIDSPLIDDIRELEQLGDFGPQSIQNQTFTAFNDTGAVNAYVITPVPEITAYAKYQAWVVDIANANTAASTMNINGLGPRNVFDVRTGAALTGGELRAGIHSFVDDGTQLKLLDPVRISGSQFFTANGNFIMPNVSVVYAAVMGGGGGGGAIILIGASGGGGGSGAVVTALLGGIAPGTTIAVVVGAAGVGRIGSTGPGTAGGASTLTVSGTVIVFAGGGGGGTSVSSPNGVGGAGGAVPAPSGFGGNAGGNGQSEGNDIGGRGAASRRDKYVPGAATAGGAGAPSNNTSGSPGVNLGSGGGGGSGAGSGGNGAPGEVMFWW